MFWFQYCHLGNLQSCSGDKPQPPPLPILFYLTSYLHVFRRAHGYDWMHFARSRQFQDLSWSSFMTTSPWMGWYFKTICNHSPHDGMLFQDLFNLMTKSVCPNPWVSPTHTHAHTITEATSYKQSMLYLFKS